MKNITLAIDEKVLAEARQFAAKEQTTVNALVREYLARVVEGERLMGESRAKLSELIDNSTGRLGPDFKWNRDDIYAERTFPRHQHSDLRGNRQTG